MISALDSPLGALVQKITRLFGELEGATEWEPGEPSVDVGKTSRVLYARVGHHRPRHPPHRLLLEIGDFDIFDSRI